MTTATEYHDARQDHTRIYNPRTFQAWTEPTGAEQAVPGVRWCAYLDAPRQDYIVVESHGYTYELAPHATSA